ncbi:tRNA(Ile)-lysidine synthase [Neoasaia chiangmaiensis]|uniref:tRNA(Ile)-lysidine synthase n=1 Tax=Neoasaia chiangmaiensis TaxID=320497 RepID=A0A1U9KNM6_9PROT|nr:tRNA lysidine(34) synthetase TilS [Neoasaia chiangmaiensis]AQS87388.1 hypothetical protein A0U93_04930 [Neoasaia chiangmaiensis]GEN16156.1 tRNA(Ile)-lysidine synthase [Neoasaia chiangmaiensis]
MSEGAIQAAEFAVWMQEFEPFPADDADYPIAVAVSGGADSLCLAWLARRWRRHVVGLIVDHGLRAESSDEAHRTAAVLDGFGMASRVLPLTGLRRDGGLQEGARAARYRALTRACREAGCLDLLIGHHAGDQAETVAMRQRAGSSAYGLAGMATCRELADLRLLRPLLRVSSARLRVTLREAGIAWAEDPSNQNRQFERVRVRQSLGTQDVSALCHMAGAHARERQEDEACRLEEAAERIVFHPGGFFLLPADLCGPVLLGLLWQVLSGRAYPPARRIMSALLKMPKACTLHGVTLRKAGRLGPGWVLCREAQAMESAVQAVDGAIWDGRWQLRSAGTATGMVVSAVGHDGGNTGLPFAVRRTLPALRAVSGAAPHDARFDFIRPMAVFSGSFWSLAAQ